MRYFTNILRWISSQEHLYFLFGLLFIIPNCVFLFTEPLPVPVGLASIVMPLAFWMGVLLLAVLYYVAYRYKRRNHLVK